MAQRPMSQRKEALNMVEKESGLRGYLVRPLSAKLLKPTIPEQSGILNRDMLMDISGRGRKRQMKLAKELGLEEYPQPAGGCKFTDINIIKRFNIMIGINKNLTWTDLELLKFGRHFYLGDNFYFITARDEAEVNQLYTYSKLGIIIEPKIIPGSTGLFINYNKAEECAENITNENNIKYEEKLKLAGQIIARYTKGCQDGREVKMIYIKDSKNILELKLSAIDEIELNDRRM
ncbi:MAG: hypothetical protein NTY22_01545 [Proteobacteria bacterium]|nr:hypothetical protein [Pseudomonadota bacterium]